jgi:hypothetical protein
MSPELRHHRTPFDVLSYEIVQEQATALGRMGRALEAALAKLRQFDAAYPCTDAPASVRQARRTLVMEAGHSLWMLVVQREACGLHDSAPSRATMMCPVRHAVHGTERHSVMNGHNRAPLPVPVFTRGCVFGG